MAEYQLAIFSIYPYGYAVLVAEKDGKIIDVKADKDTSHGDLCPRGKAAPQIVHSKSRLSIPLIRNVSKGSFLFRKLTWDKTPDLIAKRFKKGKKEGCYDDIEPSYLT